ncbi:helix-turn-helix transcriptional regulator [Robiginitalea sp. M366]|uniref:helix-turn-helix domain-containing protein n=1 Tax=Robiginitalea aestuariiviva TaxID=3036903 RepID=UPI00240D9717|nr:helix-turn-helix transcriptional regulator [Robiginitalea aestuariiviva]MDG1572807.1 helix-turn-helix transcriptional regulator [Robiginitalea aestuariiviva]
MNIEAIINFLLIAGVVQGFLFNLATFLFRKKYGMVVLYLNLVVLFISLNNLQAWLSSNGYSSDHFFWRAMVVPWYILVFPSFYNFMREYLGVKDRTLNFLPWIIGLFCLEVAVRAGVILTSADLSAVLLEERVEHYNVLEEFVNMAISLAIFLRACQLVFLKRKWYREFLSFDDIRWIKLFLILGMAIILFWMFGLGLRASEGFYKSHYFMLRLADSALLYWIGYQGLYRYNLVQDRIQIRKSLHESGHRLTPKALPATDRLQEKHMKEFKALREEILEARKYMDPDLSLEKLAREQGVSTGHLSRIINLYGSQSFNDFINELRVDQARVFLSDPDYAPYTIVSIGLECGFNSKSTFYSAFRKFAHMTPSEFRERKAGV